MAEVTARALWRALTGAFTSSDGTTYDIQYLDVRREDRWVGLTLAVAVTPGGRATERWAVSLEYDLARDFPAPDPSPAYPPRPADPLADVLFFVRTELEEWWHTKGSSGHYRKKGHRID